MPRILAQKTIRVELELTVSMDEISVENLPVDLSEKDLVHVQHLQQALLSDDAALQELMLAAALGRLHEYFDYLTTQDCLGLLRKLAENLHPEDARFFQKYGTDFFDLTRPLRRSSLSVHLDKSQIDEQIPDQPGETGWQPIWRDLAPTSELAHHLSSMSISLHPLRINPCTDARHHLIARHLTQQSDGVHLEARCTCDAILEGVGTDEDQAVVALWDRFRDHYARYQEQVEK